MTPVMPPRRQILTEEVYATIKRQLMDHEIEPGSRLNIDALARSLEVSPTPVREALARLESDGLVTKRPLYGYTAAPVLDARGFAELYEVRLLLEPPAARAAAERARPEDLERLGSLLSGMRLPAAAPETFDGYRELFSRDASFHAVIWEMSGNRLLHETLDRLHAHMHLYRLYFRNGFVDDMVVEHERILAALRARDPDAAERAMIDHLNRSRERLRPALRDTVD